MVELEKELQSLAKKINLLEYLLQNPKERHSTIIGMLTELRHGPPVASPPIEPSSSTAPAQPTASGDTIQFISLTKISKYTLLFWPSMVKIRGEKCCIFVDDVDYGRYLLC